MAYLPVNSGLREAWMRKVQAGLASGEYKRDAAGRIFPTSIRMPFGVKRKRKGKGNDSPRAIYMREWRAKRERQAEIAAAGVSRSTLDPRANYVHTIPNLEVLPGNVVRWHQGAPT